MTCRMGHFNIGLKGRVRKEKSLIKPGREKKTYVVDKSTQFAGGDGSGDSVKSHEKVLKAVFL